MGKMTSQEIERRIAVYFGFRQNLIVPNVSWGFFRNGQEVDLLIVRPSGFAIEVEIKTTASDIKADLKKKHQHISKRIKQTWFAVPEKLQDNADIPLHFGVLGVAEDKIKTVRVAKVNADVVGKISTNFFPIFFEHVGLRIIYEYSQTQMVNGVHRDELKLLGKLMGRKLTNWWD